VTPATTTRSRAYEQAVVGAALLAGPANVIMQLSWPAVGYGVYESKVESGNLFRHPVKRARTTVTYLAVALLGTDRERRLYREAVDTAHVQVRSSESSPVSYNAFDRGLQLWVAACLYRGVEDVSAVFGPPLTEDEREERYQECATLATTLQVPPEMWPADRKAYEEYWTESLAAVSIDDTIRGYLTDIAMMRFLPAPFPQLFGRFNLFVTTGFLPERFREEMRLTWSARQQRRWSRLMGAVARLVQLLPGPVRRFPYNACLLDMRVRVRLGRPLV
jgi:uncharacterized protein (DUF2236 family)